MAQVNLAVLTIANAQIQGGTNINVQVSVQTDTGNSMTCSVVFAGNATQAQMKTAILTQVKAAYLSAFPQDTVAAGVNIVAFGAPI